MRSPTRLATFCACVSVVGSIADAQHPHQRHPSLAFLARLNPNPEYHYSHAVTAGGPTRYYRTAFYDFKAKSREVERLLRRTVGRDPSWTLTFSKQPWKDAVGVHRDREGRVDMRLVFYQSSDNNHQLITLLNPSVEEEAWLVATIEATKCALWAGFGTQVSSSGLGFSRSSPILMPRDYLLIGE